MFRKENQEERCVLHPRSMDFQSACRQVLHFKKSTGTGGGCLKVTRTSRGRPKKRKMLERELTYEKLSKWTSPEIMKMSEVELFLLRIKLEESYNLKSTWSSMGM
ncbi:serpin B12-like isoform X2 [Mauremys reevesii]|uniref:serpin B12-like isoform X2 n=1 Tax=Mauremys reevesii TaxID=260615 RepID=UPI00193FC725|nr:serpin B12-like isoform X2 [Mauremys reevesii]